MYEKENKKENLLIRSENKHKSIQIKKPLFLEDYSNTESIKNSEIFSELDEDTKSYNEVNNLKQQDINIINNPKFSNKSFSHKAMNTFIGLKFRKSKVYEEDEGARESYSITYSKVLNFSKTHYILYICNLLSFSVNYESIWRFPYYFFNAEGAIFFFPFLLFYFLLGIPILTLESSLGQIFKIWPVDHFFSKIKKDHRYNFSIMTTKMLTIGISFVISIYFGSLVSQNIHYFFMAFSKDLPWEFQIGVDKLYNIDFLKINLLIMILLIKILIFLD